MPVANTWRVKNVEERRHVEGTTRTPTESFGSQRHSNDIAGVTGCEESTSSCNYSVAFEVDKRLAVVTQSLGRMLNKQRVLGAVRQARNNASHVHPDGSRMDHCPRNVRTGGNTTHPCHNKDLIAGDAAVQFVGRLAGIDFRITSIERLLQQHQSQAEETGETSNRVGGRDKVYNTGGEKNRGEAYSVEGTNWTSSGSNGPQHRNHDGTGVTGVYSLDAREI